MKAVSVGNIIEIQKVHKKAARPMEVILEEVSRDLSRINTRDEFSQYLKGNETAYMFLKPLVLKGMDLLAKIDKEKYTNPCFEIIHHMEDLFLRTEFVDEVKKK